MKFCEDDGVFPSCTTKIYNIKILFFYHSSEQQYFSQEIALTCFFLLKIALVQFVLMFYRVFLIHVKAHKRFVSLIELSLMMRYHYNRNAYIFLKKHLM